MQTGNLFAQAMPPSEGERFDTLLRHKGLVIERIVSSSKIESQQYLQAQDEWVVLLQGEAELDIDGKRLPLKTGDYVFIPSATPHTVLSASTGALWLAVHLHETIREAGVNKER